MVAREMKPRGRRGRSARCRFLLPAALLLLAVGGCGDDGGTTVPAPTAAERSDTVPILQRAAQSQGICYGWRLQDGTNVVSVGSNLGEAVAVRDNPSCPRWVEVVATVNYPPQSSEREDSAQIQVVSVGDTDTADLNYVRDGLDRFGLTEKVFIDDPGWAVCRAAVSLPLLVAERGLAGPVPVDTAAPAAAPSPLPGAGSDFWRDRWSGLLAAAGLLLLGVALLTAGLMQRRRRRRPAVPARREGAADAAAPTSGRTQERA